MPLPSLRGRPDLIRQKQWSSRTTGARRATVLLFVVSLLVPPLFSQTRDSAFADPQVLGIVDTILVAGNEKTASYVILDEMTLKPGSAATPGAIEFDRNRIYSLGLFTRVDIYYDTFEGKLFLYVDVSERWYLIPLPLFGFRDGDPKKPYYGAGLLHNNFRGRNQKLFASVIFGHNPSLSLSYYDPLLSRPHSLTFGGGLFYSRIRNRSAIESAVTGDFDEQHHDINASIGKRLTLYENINLTLGFRIVRITEYRPGRTVSPDGRDPFLYGSINFTRDSRDLREYASLGQFLSLYVTKYGFGESDVSFTRFGFDLRQYAPLPLDFTFAGRVHGTIVSGGMVPTYNRVYFGYGERIRGYFKTVFEGENMLGTTLELRFPLLAARTITVNAVPLPAEFSVWRFGISLALFGDTGVTWFRGDRLTLSAFSSGYGAGIYFLLPYSFILRTEYAYDEFLKGQFILNVRTPI